MVAALKESETIDGAKVRELIIAFEEENSLDSLVQKEERAKEIE